MRQLKTANLLGVQVHRVDRAEIIAYVQRRALGQDRGTVLYVNAHCLNVAQTDPEYREILNRANLVYPDGIGAVWASRALGGRRLQKSTGRDWIHPLCHLAASQGLKLFLLGGKPGIAEAARKKLCQRWPDLQIVGVCDGYFIGKSQTEVIADIARRAPHILLVGMGTPRQEKWIARHRDHIPVQVCWAVGALFDTLAAAEPTVPAWMDELALEWLWRLLIDPRGKWKRYLAGIPLFVARVLRQRFSSKDAEIAQISKELR